MRSWVARSAALVCFVASAVARAQTGSNADASAAAGIRPQTFGIASAVSRTIQAFDFVPFDASYNGALFGDSFGSRYCNAGCFLEAPLYLPAGATITSVEVDGCDTDAASNVFVSVFQIGLSESSKTTVATAVTSGTPGCAVLVATPGVNTIDNANNSYWVEIALGGTAGTTRFQAVRVFYKLQVSPNPATATFSDVPVSHPQHRFVEAMVAAGITAGCGGGNFCPDANLTRGQMAVFLSVALGLQWAP